MYWLDHSRSRLAVRLRKAQHRTQCFIDTSVTITSRADFAGGQGSALYHGCYILNGPGKLSLGECSHLGAYTYVNVLYGHVDIGPHVAVGPGCRLIAYSNDYAAGRLVTDLRHTGDIRVGTNVFIGANCVVLPGTVIEPHVVVGAGAVAKGTLESGLIYGGVPARPIGNIQ